MIIYYVLLLLGVPFEFIFNIPIFTIIINDSYVVKIFNNRTTRSHILRQLKYCSSKFIPLGVVNQKKKINFLLLQFNAEFLSHSDLLYE